MLPNLNSNLRLTDVPVCIERNVAGNDGIIPIKRSGAVRIGVPSFKGVCRNIRHGVCRLRRRMPLTHKDRRRVGDVDLLHAGYVRTVCIEVDPVTGFNDRPVFLVSSERSRERNLIGRIAGKRAVAFGHHSRGPADHVLRRLLRRERRERRRIDLFAARYADTREDVAVLIAEGRIVILGKVRPDYYRCSADGRNRPDAVGERNRRIAAFRIPAEEDLVSVNRRCRLVQIVARKNSLRTNHIIAVIEFVNVRLFFLICNNEIHGEGAGLEVRAVRRRAAHQAHAARYAFVPDAEVVAQKLTAGVDGNTDLVLILRLDLIAVRIIERDVDRDRIDRLAADCLLREFKRFFVADAGQHHLRAGGEDACRRGCEDAHAVRSGTVEGLRGHFGLRHFVALILRADAHEALDQRGRIDVRAVLGIPADERAAFDNGRFGQLADRRSCQNRLYDKNVAVLVDEGYREIDFKSRIVGGFRRICGLFRLFRVFRRLGLGRFFRRRLCGLVRVFRFSRDRRVDRQIADQSAAAHVAVFVPATGRESDFIHTDFGAAGVVRYDVYAVVDGLGTIGNGCQRQQLQHHNERYDDRPGASAEKDPVQL